MKSIFLTLLLSFVLLPLSAQDEQEIITFQYQSLNQAQVFNESYEDLNNIRVDARVFELTFNYGHHLKKLKSDLIYSVNYQNFKQTEDVSGVDPRSALSAIPKNYYAVPTFSQISLSSGLSKSINEKWKVVSLISLYMQDDFFSPILKPNISWGNMTYLEKSAGESFTYGFGIYLNQLKSRMVVAPWVSLRWANDERGMELLFPQKIKVWHRIMHSSALELHAVSDSYALEYSSGNAVETTDIFNIKAGLAYHYLWTDWLRLTVGADLPLNFYEVRADRDTFSYMQKNGLIFNMSISLIVPHE